MSLRFKSFSADGFSAISLGWIPVNHTHGYTCGLSDSMSLLWSLCGIASWGRIIVGSRTYDVITLFTAALNCKASCYSTCLLFTLGIERYIRGTPGFGRTPRTHYGVGCLLLRRHAQQKWSQRGARASQDFQVHVVPVHDSSMCSMACPSSLGTPA